MAPIMRAMSNLVVTDNQRFPVGTSVSAYPQASSHHGQVFGDPVETQVVAADGTLTFAALVDGVGYALAATVGGTLVRMRVIKASLSVAGTTWKARVAARRAAAGTS